MVQNFDFISDNLNVVWICMSENDVCVAILYSLDKFIIPAT
jgi:hypothetical protein